MSPPLTGLIAATFTPFTPEGALNLAPVEATAAKLASAGVSGVFIGGTTGECHSLSLQERLDLAERWAAVLKGSKLRFVVHVGSNCLPDSVALAKQAAKLGAHAVAALAPSYFKPPAVEQLVEFFAPVAAAAGDVPFYYYDIPGLTGVTLSALEFLERLSEQANNVRGVKFTNPDLMQFQQLVQSRNGRYDVLFGCDEALLAGLALGARGAVGSSYNLAAPIYRRVMALFDAGDLDSARKQQLQSVELVRTLNGYGYLGAAKAAMSLLGLDHGPVRPPLKNPTPEQRQTLFDQLRKLGTLAT